MDERDIKTEK